MKKFNYIDGIKAFDLEYDRILNECVKEVWNKDGNKPDFIINILDELDYIECCCPNKRTDEIWCYLYINICDIKICDIIRLAELIGVDYNKIEVLCNDNSEDSVVRFKEGSVYLYLFWKDLVIHPYNTR